MTLRETAPDDQPAILRLAREVAREGTTYVFAPDTPDAELAAYWLPAPTATTTTIVAERDGAIAGLYVLRPNHGGRGSHVANASFVVAAAARGQGLGRTLGEHCLSEARRRGFRAMQFNLVVSTNAGAVRLWESLGFARVGTLPRVFDHPADGEVDAYVMHRFL